MLVQGTLVSLHATVNTRFAGLQPPSPANLWSCPICLLFGLVPLGQMNQRWFPFVLRNDLLKRVLSITTVSGSIQRCLLK